eukprot:1442172-Alexandrium_andersonii.AAC.1
MHPKRGGRSECARLQRVAARRERRRVGRASRRSLRAAARAIRRGQDELAGGGQFKNVYRARLREPLSGKRPPDDQMCS